MAEEHQGQEKTEEATPRKQQKAREEGQTVRSRELGTMALVTLGAAALLLFVPYATAEVMQFTRTAFTETVVSNTQMFALLGLATQTMMIVLLPLLGSLFLAGVASSLAVGGVIFSAKAMQFKTERMNPLKGLKRMFSIQALVELGKSVAKFVLVTGVAIAVLGVLLNDILNLNRLPLEQAVVIGLEYVGWALLLIGCALILIAAIDVPFQIAQHKKQLKMTKQEVKDEMKDTEGKPEVKARIRQLQQEVANRQMLKDVPLADVVITNPDHFAVAIQYDAAAMGAPVVIAKGTDAFAFKIREVADAHRIPSVSSPPLARALFFVVGIGAEVPEGLYVAVAQVLAYVYQLKAYRSGAEPAVPHYQPAPIPEEFQRDATGRVMEAQ